MKHRTSILTMAAVAFLLMFASAANAQANNRLVVPVSGNFTASANTGPLSALGSGGFTGTLNIQQFISQAGNLLAVGNLVGFGSTGLNRGSTGTRRDVPYPLPNQ